MLLLLPYLGMFLEVFLLLVLVWAVFAVILHNLWWSVLHLKVHIIIATIVLYLQSVPSHVLLVL